MRRVERRASASRAWAALACGSLVVAGILAIALVFARMPGLDRLVTDPSFFRRCLVVHVDLALVVWQLAFLGSLWSAAPGPRRARTFDMAGAAVAATGVVAMVASALVPGALPVLSNYVPAVDHPLFAAGLVLIGGGVLLLALDGRLLRSGGASSGLGAPAAAGTFLRAAVLACCLALLTFFVSALTLPPGLDALPRWELLGWGGGHVLQFASVAAMLACWVLLVGAATGREVVSPRVAAAVAAWLCAPLLAAPVLAALPGGSRHGFTRLMEIGIAPPTLVVMGACFVALRRASRDGLRPLSTAPAVGFVASASLTLLGFTIGLSIQGSNTMVPAHYHASIGGVTCAFMALTPRLLEAVGVTGASARPWLARLQPLAFAGGQAVFAAGFALAGAHGAARKVYGAEQARSAIETAGLAVMGFGGLVAVAAGLLFLVMVARAWTRHVASRPMAAGRLEWKNQVARGIPSRG